MQHRSSDSFEKPHPDGKHYDPEGYENLELFRVLATIGGFIGFSIIGISFLSMDAESSPARFLVPMLLFMAIFALAGAVYSSMENEHNEKVASAKRAENRETLKSVKASEGLLLETNQKLEEQMSQLESMKDARSTGDIIINNNHAPVVISSTIRNSFNSISGADPELASAIKDLGGFIENSGNKVAAEYFDELHELLAREDQSPVTLRALWQGILTALPAVATLTDVVAKISKLF